MTDHTPEELAEYYKDVLERIVSIAPCLTITALETNEGRNYADILAGPPPKPKWTAGDTNLNYDDFSKVTIDYMVKDRAFVGEAHYGKIVIFNDDNFELRDAIIDFLNKREEEFK